MSNIRSKINCHNKKILQTKPAEPQKLCNCLVKEDCPMNGLCLTSSILYQATIKCSDSNKKDTKESVKRHSRNVMQTTKNHSTLVISQCRHRNKFELVSFTSRKTPDDVI